MKIEITKEAFRSIVEIDAKCVSIHRGETYSQADYHEKGCHISEVINFVSACKQYYIEDINA